ncbi:MAG: TetR/AcrR family transcriptional regulator [Actinomycetota bacterium]
MAESKRRTSSAGDETRTRILDATLTTLADVGIAGTSARAIAKRGDLNQALIFYHFGSVDDAVIAAVERMSDERMGRHAAALAGAETLGDLVRIAKQLHADDTRTNNMTVLAQAFAGAAGNPETGPKLYASLERWSDMVTESIRRVLAPYPAAAIVPAELLGQSISALFLGIELLSDLDPARADADRLFTSLEGAAAALQLMLDSGMAATSET